MAAVNMLNKLSSIYQPRTHSGPATRSAAYIDFNNNARTDKGEALAENNTADKFLRNIINNETNIIYIKKAYDVLNANDRNNTDLLNKFESELIAKACFIASGVPEPEIPAYLTKLSGLFAGFKAYEKRAKLFQRYSDSLFKLIPAFLISEKARVLREVRHKSGAEETIDLLNKYLWKNGEDRYLSGWCTLDAVVDKQFEYFKNFLGLDDHFIGVGDCVGLTALFTVLGVRAGIDLSTVEVAYVDMADNHKESLHILNRYKNQDIENTSKDWGYGLTIVTDNPEVAYSHSFDEFNIVATIINEKVNDLQGISALNLAVKMYPLNASYYKTLGEIYSAHREHIKAIDAYNRVLALGMGMPSVYFALSSNYAHLGKYHEAQEAYLQGKNAQQAPEKELLKRKRAALKELDASQKTLESTLAMLSNRIKNKKNADALSKTKSGKH